MSNAAQLRALMDEHYLTRPRTAELAGYSLASVDCWLLDESSPHHRRMPDRALALIRLRLQEVERMSNQNASVNDLVLCQSPDGWSLHPPGSSDEDIANGDAPYLLDGPGEPAEADWDRAWAIFSERR